MQNMTCLFYGILETIIAKLIYIKLTDSKHKYESKIIIDLKNIDHPQYQKMF